MINKIVYGDALDVLKTLEKNSFNFCFSDPPYNTMKGQDIGGMKKRSNIARGTDFDKEFTSYPQYLTFIQNIVKEIMPLMKEDANFAFWFAIQNVSDLIRILERYNFKYLTTITWIKSNPRPMFRTTRTFNPSCEYLIWFQRGTPTFNYLDHHSMFNYYLEPVIKQSEKIRDEKKEILHATQKSKSITKHFLKIGANRNEFILDPFAGTATTNECCLDLEMNCISIEKNLKYYKGGTKRLKECMSRLNPNKHQKEIQDYFGAKKNVK